MTAVILIAVDSKLTMDDEELNIQYEILKELKQLGLQIDSLISEQQYHGELYGAMVCIMSEWKDSDGKHHKEESNTLRIVQKSIKKKKRK